MAIFTVNANPNFLVQLYNGDFSTPPYPFVCFTVFPQISGALSLDPLPIISFTICFIEKNRTS